MTRRTIIIIISIIGTFLLGLAAIAVFGIYSFFQYMMAPAQTFFTTLDHSGVDAAYQSTSTHFQENTTLDEFSQFVEANKLTDYTKTHWSSANTSGTTGVISGSVERRDGARLAVTVDIISEHGQWKVSDIKLGKSSIGNGSNSGVGLPSLPNDTEATALATTSWHTMLTYIENKDYDGFYDWVSPAFRTSYTREKFATDLAETITTTVRQALQKSEVTVERPATYDSDTNIMHLYGSFYGSDLGHVYYRLDFTYDYPDWKVSGFQFKDSPFR